MKQGFKRIILYARQHRANQEVAEALQRLIDFLKNKNKEVYLDVDTAHLCSPEVPVLERSHMGGKEDLIVVVGGDGSLLSAARIATELNLPVIGINRGRLGFLTDISPQNLETEFGPILSGHYKEEQRFLLKVTIYEENTAAFHGVALNDVVLSRGTQTQLIEFDVHVDQQFVSYYRADGLIISTPTGSTAYALSAGGPIMHPALNAIVMVPMFSHSLSSRPLVVAGEAGIDLHISAHNEHDLQISCDGHESHHVKPEQRVSVQKNKQLLRLLHPTNYNYYDTLRIKLGWGFKPLG